MLSLKDIKLQVNLILKGRLHLRYFSVSFKWKAHSAVNKKQ